MSIITLGFPGLVVTFGFASGVVPVPVDTTYVAYPDPFAATSSVIGTSPDPFAAAATLKG